MGDQSREQLGELSLTTRLSLLETLVASAALVVGGCLFVGYKALAFTLYYQLGYTGSIFLLVPYEQVLMQGVDTVVNYCSDKFAVAATAAYLLFRVVPPRRKKALAYTSVWLYLVLVIAIQIFEYLGRGAFVFQLLRQYDFAVVTTLLAVGVLATAVVAKGMIAWLSTPARRFGLVVLIWAYACVLVPAVARGAGFPAATATIVFKDKHQEVGFYFQHREGVIIIGDHQGRRILMIDAAQVDRIILRDPTAP
jgi:hypothetical protein